jgi:predicted nucleic acid-binding protein
MADRTLVIDANVLLRAVLGRRVSDLLERFALTATFLAPETAFDEAHEHMAAVLQKRGAPSGALKMTLDKLQALRAIVRPMEGAEYEPMREAALARIGPRDPDDWPVLACALAVGCPIWTEDRDFFGTGVAIWTSASVEIFLAEPLNQGGTIVEDLES